MLQVLHLCMNSNKWVHCPINRGKQINKMNELSKTLILYNSHCAMCTSNTKIIYFYMLI